MRPRQAVHLLGLCNLVAGALLASAPTLLLPIDGVQSAAGNVLARGLAVVLVAIGIAGWALPDAAVRTYLWVFGVGVKGLGAALWAITAWTSGVAAIGVGAAVDGVLALLIAWSLSSGRATSLEQPVDGHARSQNRHPAQ
jgi:hypothetical protein